MKLTKITSIMLIATLLFIPVFTEFAGAETYSTYRITVSKSYRYVGFTPEKIYIKTNWRLPKDIASFTSQFRVETVTVTLYEYWGGGWHKADSQTYHNKYGIGIAPVNEEFDYSCKKYYKSWWDRIKDRPYLQINIDLPQDKNLIHHCSFPHKIEISLQGKALINTGWNWNIFNWQSFSVHGFSGKYSIYNTPYDKYRRYWGYSISAYDYNEVMSYNDNLESQYGEYETSLFERYDTADYVLISSILCAIVISIVFVFYYKRKYYE